MRTITRSTSNATRTTLEHPHQFPYLTRERWRGNRRVNSEGRGGIDLTRERWTGDRRVNSGGRKGIDLTRERWRGNRRVNSREDACAGGRALFGKGGEHSRSRQSYRWNAGKVSIGGETWRCRNGADETNQACAMRTALFTIVFSATWAAAMAWACPAHMLVAEIAKRNLPGKDRTELDRVMGLVNAISGTIDNTFTASACWPDDLKRNNLHVMEDWHVIDLTYNPESIPLNVTNEQVMASRNNIVNVLNEMHGTLRQCDGMPGGCGANKTFELSFSLHWVVHLVAEIHSPLHCVTRYTNEYPKGDSHGKMEIVDVDGMHVDLHRYWDGAAGQLDPVPRPLDAQGLAYLQGWVNRLMEEFPPSHFGDVGLGSFQEWAMEGYRLAVDAVYTYDNATLDKGYQAQAHKITRRQLALAGYRLSTLLLNFPGVPKHCRALRCLCGGLCVGVHFLVTIVVLMIVLTLTTVVYVYSVVKPDPAVHRPPPSPVERSSGPPRSMYEDAQETLENPLLSSEPRGA